MPEKTDSELIIHRTFDAPRTLVWNAWTEADQMKQWSAPKDFTIPFNDGELRVGGKWRTRMVKSDGTELSLGGVYREINPPGKLVFTHAWDGPDGKPGPETLVTVILTERDGKTEMNFRQSGFTSVEDRDSHAEGWGECFDLLEDLLLSHAA